MIKLFIFHQTLNSPRVKLLSLSHSLAHLLSTTLFAIEPKHLSSVCIHIWKGKGNLSYLNPAPFERNIIE